MYTAGNLIYFDPFYFKDGSPSKSKYFLVLKVIDDKAILATLPSSVDHLPRTITINHGCLEIPEGCINCYIFKSNVMITKNGWAFQFDTFLYGQWIDDYSVELLNDIYPVEEIDYHVIGELTDTELKNVIECFKNSASVKRKYKRMLN
ncbi:MAG: hypothetical protein ACTHMI_24410 [Mucilaginibacter sp.]